MTSAPGYIAEFKWMLMLVVIVKLRLSYWPRSHTWLVTEFSWLSDQCPLIRKSGRCIKPWIVNAFQFSPELSWKLCNGLCFGATFLLIFTVRTTVNMQQVTANNFFLCSLDVYLSPSAAAWCRASQIPELRGHTQAWEPWFQQKSRPCGHTFWTLKRPFWYLMKSACEQGQLMFSESSRFKETELLENHNRTQLTWWNKSVGLSCPLLRDWFTTLTAFSASSRSSPVNFVVAQLLPCAFAAQHLCCPRPLPPSCSSPIPIPSLRLLEAFPGPPKAECIPQPFERLQLAELTAITKSWSIYFVLLWFCTLLTNLNKNDS